MKKTKLSTKLINNAFNFYNENFLVVFSSSETENLSSKLQEIIEYDKANSTVEVEVSVIGKCTYYGI